MNNNYDFRKCKAIAMDLDGTLLRNDATLSELARDVLYEIHKMNIILIVITGRSYVGIPDSVKKLSFIDYYITSNGTFCYNHTGEIIYKKYINSISSKKVFDVFKNVAALEVLADGKWYIERKDVDKFKFIIKDTNLYNYIMNTRVVLDDFDELFGKNLHIEKININFFEDQRLNVLEKLEEVIKDCGDLRCWSDKGHKMDIYNIEANKANMLRMLMNSIMIDQNNVITFGNDDNDVEMFGEFPLSVAMENSNINAKKVAHFATKSNDQDGVAYFLLKNILSKSEEI